MGYGKFFFFFLNNFLLNLFEFFLLEAMGHHRCLTSGKTKSRDENNVAATEQDEQGNLIGRKGFVYFENYINNQ